MAAKSWLPISPTSHFSLANIPFGIISTASSKTPRPAIAIGDSALDLAIFASNNGFSALPSIYPHLSVFTQPTLNAFAALGRPIHRAVRKYLQSILTSDTAHPQLLKTNHALQQQALIPLHDLTTHLPLHIGNYTDFYAGLHHAHNVGVLLRGPAHALQPNYTHLPVAYHGRASSVVVSGTPIRRPCGQILPDSPPAAAAEPKRPILAPSRKLDIELELGAFVCRGNDMGAPIRIADAAEHVFGLVLLNDWSARDIQAWEYVPLGPFGAKNFGTSVSAWVVLADALEPFLVRGLEAEGGREGGVLPYLREGRGEGVYDVRLEVDLTTKSGTTTTVTRTNGRNLLWSFPQMVAHHSVTGCPMLVGDLLGSGTISGTEPGTEGSLLEQCHGGKSVVKLRGGEERTFLEDGDVVTIRGWCGGEEGGLVGFGECVGRIEPAIQM